MPTNVIPFRRQYLDVNQPQPHTSVPKVMAVLAGIDLSQFAQTTAQFADALREIFIPEATSDVVAAMSTPYDWFRYVHFDDGTAGDTIILPYRNPQFIDVCFVRILPSLPWYRFMRFRNTDGSEFDRASFPDPPQTPEFQSNQNVLQPANVVPQPQFTGIEDADLLLNPRSRELVIPPRALILAAGLPLSNYAFIAGKLNVETHAFYGFQPTKYESGTPLAFDGNGVLQDPNPTPPNGWAYGADPVDWSSGMPAGLSVAVARLVANRLLRQKWRGASDGMASISVDGANESYGSKPFGGDLEAEEQSVIDNIVAKYGIQFRF